MSEEKRIVSLEDVPSRVNLQVNTMLTLPDLEAKRVALLPSTHKNMWVLIKHELFRRRSQPRGFKNKEPKHLIYEPQKIHWDKDGWPYIKVDKRKIVLEWVTDEDDFLDRYQKASDYCDECEYPLLDQPDDVLSWMSGDIAAEMYECPNCHEENERKM